MGACDQGDSTMRDANPMDCGTERTQREGGPKRLCLVSVHGWAQGLYNGNANGNVRPESSAGSRMGLREIYRLREIYVQSSDFSDLVFCETEVRTSRLARVLASAESTVSEVL